MSREPIRKESSGRYVAVLDVAAPGEKRSQLKRRFATYKDARTWVAQTRAELAEHRFVRPERTTLATWVERWIPVMRTQTRPSTAASYERNLRLHVLPRLGSRQLQSIKPAELTALYAELLAGGRLTTSREPAGPMARRTVAYIATIVGKALEAAVRGELLLTNPARRAEVPRAAATADRHEAMHTWTGPQLSRFLAESREHRFYEPWLLLATTGMRRGEALGLAWSDLDLDLDGGRLTVRRTLVDVDHGAPAWSDPKTARGRRRIALDPGTVAVLRSLRARQAEDRLAVGPAYAGHDLVFARPDGGPIHPETFSRAFKDHAVRLELPPIRLHDLRHTWATLALLAGVHPKVVQERLGHSSVTVTLDLYSHVVPAMETDAADRVAAMILGGGG